jgi:hypothetical protein
MNGKISLWIYIVAGIGLVGLVGTLLTSRSQKPNETPQNSKKYITTSTVKTEPPAKSKVEKLKCSDIEIERRKYKITVVSTDLSQGFGVDEIKSYLIRIKISNNSKITLPTLTVMSKTFDNTNSLVTSSRAPSVDVHSVRPGDSVTIDHYAKGYIPGWNATRAEVYVEDVVSSESRQFFSELQDCTL